MYYYGHGYNVGYDIMSTFGALLHIVFWVLVILLIIRFVRGRRGQNWHGWMHDKTALDILKERYAKGEINREEFEEKKKDLL